LHQEMRRANRRIYIGNGQRLPLQGARVPRRAQNYALARRRYRVGSAGS
jgi:hypothetical protein